MENVSNDENLDGDGRKEVPIAAYHPDFGLVNMQQSVTEVPKLADKVPVTEPHQVSTEKESEEDSNSERIIEGNNSQMVIHGRDGPYLMGTNKWPKLTLPSEKENMVGGGGWRGPTEVLTQEDSLVNSSKIIANSNVEVMECALTSDKLNSPTLMEHEEDLMDNFSIQSLDSDIGEGISGWRVPKSKKARKKARRNIVVATRTSSRMPRDGLPIAEKAAQRVKAWNESSGISSISQSPFTILNNTHTPELSSVIHDLSIGEEEVVEQVDIFKIEELARASIAKANYKQFLEKLKEKDKPTEEELLEDMAMETISNLQRGFVNESPNGGGSDDLAKGTPEALTPIILS